MATSNSVLRWTTLVLRVVLGGIFVYAAWVKIREPWELFAMNIDAYKLLPEAAVTFVARTLPWFELVVGLVLITGWFFRTASSAVSALLIVFFALMIRAKLKGQEINCGCFGGTDPISWKTMLRDGSMLAASLFVTAMAFVGRRRSWGRLQPAEDFSPTPRQSG
jgi:putative oxidoreductase